MKLQSTNHRRVNAPRKEFRNSRESDSQRSLLEEPISILLPACTVSLATRFACLIAANCPLHFNTVKYCTVSFCSSNKAILQRRRLLELLLVEVILSQCFLARHKWQLNGQKCHKVQMLSDAQKQCQSCSKFWLTVKNNQGENWINIFFCRRTREVAKT